MSLNWNQAGHSTRAEQHGFTYIVTESSLYITLGTRDLLCNEHRYWSKEEAQTAAQSHADVVASPVGNEGVSHKESNEAAIEAGLDQALLGGTDRYSQLLNGDDPVALFCGGGCHVFALELNARYGYPLMLWERAHGRIAHVYCLRNGIEIDAQAPVVGKGIFERFDVGTERLTHKPVTVVKLLEMVPGDNWEKEKGGPYGLRDEGSFMVLAREKARIFLDEDARKGDRARFPPSALADQKPS